MTGPSRLDGHARAVWLLILVFVLSLPAVTTRINASDEIQFFSWLHSWTFDRDVDFENEYRYFHDAGPGRTPGFISTFLEDTNEAGRRPNFAPIGSAILWMPFYAAGHLAAGLSGALTDGLGRPYVAAVAYGSAVYGLLALLLSASIVRRLLGGSGIGPAAIVWAGTPLIFYMYVAPAFAHATSAFAVALFLWIWLRIRDRWSMPGVVALGLAAALLPMVREQDAFFVLGPALDFARFTWRHVRGANAPTASIWRRPLLTAAVGIATAGLAYLPQLAAYQALNGHPTPTDKVARKMTWSSPHFFDVLISPQHGLFLWTPLAAVAIAGLIWLLVSGGRRAHAASPPPTIHASDLRWIAGLMLVMTLLQIYVSGSVESWTVAGAFGQRRFVALTPVLAVGLAACWPTGRRRVLRALAVATAALLIWWNVGLMAQFGLHIMDRQRLEIAGNARVTFVDLPRLLPSIVVRYVVDRESFYGLPRE
ncbi:MAG: hypothetical protein ABS36_09080 [Acidobacteria bacterium SCN 69-37]|nr:MAG: hypothetical protein ABS36_09080 [Acidobacteria bacterium SCN 69-37]